MPPRGRSRQPRLTRMDAAIDAMAPFGFRERLVRGKVKDLLREYGGDVGWPFIEADAYKLLIEGILDEQEEEARGETRDGNGSALLDEPLQDGRVGNFPLAADAGPSCLAPASTRSEVVDVAVQTSDTDGGDDTPPAEGPGKECKDFGLAQICDEARMVDAGKSCDSQQLQQTALDLTLNSSLPRRRKPCYGWISSDDDNEEEDFIVLTRAPPLKPAALSENMPKGMDRRRKRKVKWDVRPQDV